MAKIDGFRELMRKRLNIDIFIGPNFVSRAKDIAAVNHVTQAVVRVGS